MDLPIVLLFEVPLVLCLFLLLCKVVGQWKGQTCYLLHYECFKPSNDRKLSTDCCGEIIARNKNLGQQEYKFLLQVMVRCGMGEETYGPRNILAGRENNPTLGDCLSEMDEFFVAALDELFRKCKVSPEDIDILVVNVSTFAPVPSLTSQIINHYKMRDDIKAYNLSGMGCSASPISINLVQNMFKSHQNALAIVVSCESMALNWYTGNDRSFILSNILFRCGGCLMLLTNKRALRKCAKLKLKHLVRTHLGSDEAYACVQHKEDDQGHLGFFLGKSLTKVATRALSENLRALAPKILPLRELLRYIVLLNFNRVASHYTNGKRNVHVNFKTGIDHFCLHTGGTAVIDGIRNSLELSEHDVESARMTLHRFGNTSVSSIWYVLGYIEAKKRLKKGDRVLQIGLGAGFMCNSCFWEVVRDFDDDRNAWDDCIDHYPPETLVNPYLEKFGWVMTSDQYEFDVLLRSKLDSLEQLR